MLAMFSAFLLYLVIDEMFDMYPYTPYLQMERVGMRDGHKKGHKGVM